MSIITDLISPITDIINRFVPDATKKAEMAQELATLATKQAHEIALQQTDVNKVEAASASIFVAGWRPAIGWICGFSLAYAAILDPLLRFIAQVGFGYADVFPIVDTNLTMQVLLGMLGLAGMRSWEGSQGVKRESLKK